MSKKEKNPTTESLKKTLTMRAIVIYIFVIVVGVTVFWRIIDLQFFQKEQLERVARPTVNLKTLPVERGTIYSRNHEPLVKRSVKYGIYMDTNPYNPIKKGDSIIGKEYLISDSIFYANVKALADSITQVFGPSKPGWEQKLRTARSKKDHYFKICANADVLQANRVENFPILCEPNKYNALISKEILDKVEYPYGELARRTLGEVKAYEVKTDTGKIVQRDLVGLEGFFDKELSGTPGLVMRRSIPKTNIMIDMESDQNIAPCNGYDIFTTLDMNIQDVTHQSLLKNLMAFDADEGCVIVMEVASGDIIAMTNISKDSKGNYRETKNIALTNYEPGSTFKTASLLVALNDGKISKNTKIPMNYINPGDRKPSAKVGSRNVRDDHNMQKNAVDVWEVLAQSSNVGATRAIYDYYSKNQQQFIDGLYKLGFKDTLFMPVLGGSQKPLLRSTSDPIWSKLSISTIPMGYEVEVTPLNLLMFYNAIANNGKLVKPRLVSKISLKDSTIRSFDVEVLKEQICSKEALTQIQAMLDSVITCGTGKKGFKDAPYRVAGKTGTSKIHSPDAKDENLYNTSFCGYFPVDNPKYSCIVLIKKPRNTHSAYGGTVALPVFRDIADKLYVTDYDLIPKIDKELANEETAPISLFVKAQKETLESIFKGINFNFPINANSDWVSAQSNGKNVSFGAVSLSGKRIPDVQGMSMTDAVYVMEKAGLLVEVSGFGRVKKQIPEANTPLKKGERVILKLEI